MSAPPAGSPRKRRSEIVVPHRPKWHGEIAACAIWLLGSGLATTWRLRVEDKSAVPLEEKGPFIAAIWHNRLAVAMPVWKWWQTQRPGYGLAALISASRDGALLARTFSYFGVKPIRGSSSRRGAQALLEATSALESEYHVAITPDGPRGPKYTVQPGIISLAQVTERRIIPIGVRVAHKKQLRSWDGFQIPWPFTRCEAVFAPPISIPRHASPEEHEKARQKLETILREINED